MNEFSSSACRGASSLDDVITRSKNSKDVQTIVAELPEVPRIPSKKRTFHLNHDDLQTLVQPLLSCHWHVGRVRDGPNGLEVFSLNKLFSFKDFTSAVEFFDLLTGIQNEENHHTRVTVDYTNVYVSTHTHCAYQNAFDAGVDAKPIKVPGLTSRDIRIAVKVERVHDAFLRDERAVTKVPVDSASLQAWSMEQLRRRYPAHIA